MGIGDVAGQMPRIENGKIMEDNEIVERITTKTGRQESDVVGMMADFKDVIYESLRQARPMRMKGIGIFSVSVKLNGQIKVKVRSDKTLEERLNMKGGFSGTIKNKANIGKTMQELEAIAAANPAPTT